MNFHLCGKTITDCEVNIIDESNNSNKSLTLESLHMTRSNHEINAKEENRARDWAWESDFDILLYQFTYLAWELILNFYLCTSKIWIDFYYLIRSFQILKMIFQIEYVQ